MKKTTQRFDPAAFLAKIGSGRSLLQFSKNQKIFSQGAAADSVFYVLKGKVKVKEMGEK